MIMFEDFISGIYSDWATTKIYLEIGFGLIICAVGWWFWNQRKKYPIQAIILERRGSAHKIKYDKLGKFANKEKFTFYKLKKGKATMPPMSFELIEQQAGSAGVVFLYQYGTDQYKVIDTRGLSTDQAIKLIDYDDWNWKTVEYRNTNDKRQSTKDWMDKWLPVISLALVGFIVLITLYFSYGLIKDEAAQCIAARGQPQQVQVIPQVQQGTPINNNPAYNFINSNK